MSDKIQITDRYDDIILLPHHQSKSRPHMSLADRAAQFSPFAAFILSIVATIGQGSMVETFAHMRTPVFMSLMRGFDGALWGAVIGCVVMGALYLWQYIASSTDRSKSLNE